MILAELTRLLESRGETLPVVVHDVDAMMDADVETIVEEKDKVRIVVRGWAQIQSKDNQD